MMHVIETGNLYRLLFRHLFSNYMTEMCIPVYHYTWVSIVLHSASRGIHTAINYTGEIID